MLSPRQTNEFQMLPFNGTNTFDKPSYVGHEDNLSRSRNWEEENLKAFKSVEEVEDDEESLPLVPKSTTLRLMLSLQVGEGI